MRKSHAVSAPASMTDQEAATPLLAGDSKKLYLANLHSDDFQCMDFIPAELTHLLNSTSLYGNLCLSSFTSLSKAINQLYDIDLHVKVNYDVSKPVNLNLEKEFKIQLLNQHVHPMLDDAVFK